MGVLERISRPGKPKARAFTLRDNDGNRTLYGDPADLNVTSHDIGGGYTVSTNRRVSIIFKGGKLIRAISPDLAGKDQFDLPDIGKTVQHGDHTKD